MAKSTLILVYLVEKHKVGYTFVRSRSAWPLHITIVPWFAVEAVKLSQLLPAVGKYLESISRFTAVVDDVANFGVNNDIPVNVISNSKPFRNLQTGLLEIVSELGQLDNTNDVWLGDEYRPHITHHDGKQLVAKDMEPIDDLTLVSLEADSVCRVIKIFRLGRADETKA